MQVTVFYFARLRELAGCSTWACEVPDGATVRDVWEASATRFPSTTPMAASLSCAINADFSRMDAPVREGDEVAFLPPVSGGNWI
jgi:molybdopterin converting factor subunit 1